jgi:response regulator of citrate/malate metabolism
MNEKTMRLIKENSKNINVLIAEDDLVMQALYKRIFEGMFGSLIIKNDGLEAHDYIMNNTGKTVDLLIVDNYMPNMDGIELVTKVRAKDYGMRIIVMTQETDYNHLSDYMLCGVDAILPKPYNEDILMTVLNRTLYYLNEKKLLEHYVQQLEWMVQENLARKSEELRQRGDTPRTPKIKKETATALEDKSEPSLIDKYKIRNSTNEMEMVDVDTLDIFGKERIELFHEQISDYEFALCSVEDGDILGLRMALMEVLNGIRDLVTAINILEVFPIAANAASNLIDFIEKLDNSLLEDSAKRELFIDILVTMLEDFSKWIDMVFISKKSENIHYFDASFANTCLELEMIFKVKEEKRRDAEILEFF